ncbi:MAG TPA: hypothetical protein VER96_36625 [Polyangiaceae bacterium]|nr:hypothetical protein [Polyangiaceae bacterium]
MQRSQNVEGIANGHWERSEPRSAWLLMLARMGVAELRLLGDWAREHTDQRSVEPPNKETAH